MSILWPRKSIHRYILWLSPHPWGSIFRRMDHSRHPKPADRRRTSIPTEQQIIEGQYKMYSYLIHLPTSSSEAVQDAKALLLPVELHSLILETFWEGDDLGRREMSTVRACTSVCKVWRAAARPHLFRSIKIRSQASLERLTPLIHSDPSIASYIRKVLLQGSGGDCKDGWMYAFPSVLKNPLPSLKTLEIYNLEMRKPQKKDIRAYCDWIYTLSELASVRQVYSGLVFMSPNAFTALVRAFPRLTKVWMEQVPPGGIKNRAPVVDESSRTIDASHSNLADNRPLAYPILHPPPSIRSIQVDNIISTTPFNFDHLKNWLVPEVISSSLTSFELMPSVHIASVGRIITAASSSLDFLQIPTQGTSISDCPYSS